MTKSFTGKFFLRRKGFLFVLFFVVHLLPLNIWAGSPGKKDVQLVRDDAHEKVNILVDGKLFTSYRYPKGFEKPFLFPVIAANGSVITRGYPIEPRKGERVDHPHHTGIWFNHGNVNGLDFWNNSSAIPADKKNEYGHIVHKSIINTKSGDKGVLEVETEWDDSSGNVLLKENTRYIITADENTRIIDHISTLTAVNGKVIIGDSKEGMFAIRVDRALEMPSEEALIFTDEKGNPTEVKATDNKGVTGMYYSSTGLKGDAVWGIRNDWVMLTGEKDGSRISLAIIDNPSNPGYPAYAHARGYGLFAVNNMGRNSYDQKLEKTSYTIEKGSSVTLKHRFVLKSGSELTSQEAGNLFLDFKNSY